MKHSPVLPYSPAPGLLGGPYLFLSALFFFKLVYHSVLKTEVKNITSV